MKLLVGLITFLMINAFAFDADKNWKQNPLDGIFNFFCRLILIIALVVLPFLDGIDTIDAIPDSIFPVSDVHWGIGSFQIEESDWSYWLK